MLPVPLTFHLITLFPGAFKSYLGESIVARAIREKKIAVRFYNPRDFTKDKWRRIDQRPYGGGPGMVIQAEPVIKAVTRAYSNVLKNIRIRGKRLNPKIIWFSPSGKQFTNEYAKKAAQKNTDVIIICGRYEGIDARVKKIFKAEEISVGPYVLTGGELPAMVVIDAIARQIEGVLGNFDSVEERRVTSSEVYTRPEVFAYRGKKYRVPGILLSGHHAKVEEWRKRRMHT